METNGMNKTSPKGFTLIELVIALTVIGLLSTLAVPAYDNYVQRTRRTDAQGALTGLANAMERYHTANNTYAGATVGAGGIFAAESPLDGSTKFYDLSIATSSVTAYVLYATPKGGQAGNGRVELDSTGNRVWNTKDDGSGTDQTW